MKDSSKTPKRNISLLIIGLGMFGLSACLSSAEGNGTDNNPSNFYTAADFDQAPKFDSHVHVNSSDPILLNLAEKLNFELLSINVDYPAAFPPLDVQSEITTQMAQLSPEKFHYATTFPMTDFESDNWADKIIKTIREDVEDGAVAVKIWKNIGMTERYESGELVMLDDPLFAPIAESIKALDIPLIGHLAEPKNCWLPVEEMTTANDKKYFGSFPQYHMYLHPEMPSYEEQIGARDQFLDQNPDLDFVGAHIASLEWSVERVAEFLERYPRATVDLAARMTQVQYQSHRDYDAVRDFFIQYQDRILYGSDLTQAPNADEAQFAASAEATWRRHWAYLATNETQRVDDIDATVTGLALPKSVIDKIFYENSRRVFLSD